MGAGFGPMMAGIYFVTRGQQERPGDMLLSIFCSNNIIAQLRYLPSGELYLELIYQRADPFRKLLAGGVDRPYAEVAQRRIREFNPFEAAIFETLPDIPIGHHAYASTFEACRPHGLDAACRKRPR